jgi:hypothetical protein
MTQVAPGVSMKRLSSIQGPISGVFGNNFDTLRNKMNILCGVDNYATGFHCDAAFMSCAAPDGSIDKWLWPITGSTVDAILENSKDFYTSPTRFGALRIGAVDSWYRPDGGRSTNIIGKGQGFQSPKALFDAYFNGISGGSAQPTSSPSSEKLLTDTLASQLKSFMSNLRLGAEDRSRVQQHVDLVTDLQKRMQAAPVTMTAQCQAPNFTGKEDLDCYFDSIIAAFNCDLTRIAQMKLGFPTDGGTYHANTHREYQNGKTPEQNCIDWLGWQAKNVARFLQKMDSVIEADGSTMLDNTMVVWGSETSDPYYHDNHSVPLMIAGGGGGVLSTGNYIDYRDNPLKTDYAFQTPGVTLAAVWETLLTGLGVNAFDINRQGDDGGLGLSIPQEPHRGGADARRTIVPFLRK